MTREEQLTAELKKHDYDDICCHLMFLRGIRWADAHPINVWHDVSEMPKDGEWILVRNRYDIYDALVQRITSQDIWCAWSADNNITRWAYISDLLPKGGEK